MARFLVTYHAPASTWAAMNNATPEEMQEGMKPWMAWAEKCGDALVDFGTPLGGGQVLRKSGSSASDARFTVGYSWLQADDIEGAKALLVGHPHLEWAEGCEIEVHESTPMGTSSA